MPTWYPTSNRSVYGGGGWRIIVLQLPWVFLCAVPMCSKVWEPLAEKIHISITWETTETTDAWAPTLNQCNHSLLRWQLSAWYWALGNFKAPQMVTMCLQHREPLHWGKPVHNYKGDWFHFLYVLLWLKAIKLVLSFLVAKVNRKTIIWNCSCHPFVKAFQFLGRKKAFLHRSETSCLSLLTGAIEWCYGSQFYKHPYNKWHMASFILLFLIAIPEQKPRIWPKSARDAGCWGGGVGAGPMKRGWEEVWHTSTFPEKLRLPPEIKAGTMYLQDVGRVSYVIRNYNSLLENFKINYCSPSPIKDTKLDKGLAS